MLNNSNRINAKILLIPLSIVINLSNINAMDQINKANIFNNINNNSVETTVNSEVNIIDGETNISSINNNIYNNINNTIPNINNINNTDLNTNNNIIENKINTISSATNNNAYNNFKINTNNIEIENNINKKLINQNNITLNISNTKDNIFHVDNNISNNNIATSINDINTSTINVNDSKNKIIDNNIILKTDNTVMKENYTSFDDAKYVLKSIGEGNNNPINKQKAVQFIKSLANKIDSKLKTNNNKDFKQLFITDEILANLNYYNFTEDIIYSTVTDNQSKMYYSNVIDFIANCYYDKEINKSEYKAILQYMLYNNTTQLVNIMFNYYSQEHDAYSYKAICKFINWFRLPQIDDNNIRRKHDNVMSCMQKIIECLAEFEFRESKLNPLELNGDCKINKKSYKLLKNKVYSEVFKKIILPAFHDQLIDETSFFSTMFQINTRQAIKAYLNDTNLQCEMSRKFNLSNICQNTLMTRINYINKELKILAEQITSKQSPSIKSKYIAKHVLNYIPPKLIANFRNPNFKSK